MSGTTKSRWPLAFFILNVLAIAVWFAMTGVFEPGTAMPRSFSPYGGELDAGAIEQVDVVFDTSLDPESVGPHSLRLHPPAAGTTELVDGRTLRYRLHEKLQPATSYRLSWSDTLRGHRGQAVGREFYTFATTRPALATADQAGFDSNSYAVLLTFNHPIRADTLTTALSSRFSGDNDFRRDDPRVRVITSGAARSHRLRVSAEKAGWLVLRLAAGMAAMAGNLGLENDLDLVWRLDGGGDASAPDWAGGGTVRDLKPELAFKGMEADWDDEDGFVIIRTSSPLDSANAAKLVSIEPQVQFSCVSYWGGMKLAGEFEPGRQYRVTLKPGLSAGAAGNIPEAITRSVWFDDRPPSLDFAFGGGYLLPNGLLKLPVVSTNVDKFTLHLRRLYPSNLVETALGSSETRVYEQYAGEVKEVEIATAGKRNEKTETLVDLRELIDGDPAGVYGVEIRSADNIWRRRQATVVVSDIGLGARVGREQLFAWTMALGEGEPLSGSDIKVYSNRRQLLVSGRTGDDGTVTLELPPLPDGESPMLVVASAKGETTFVHLGNHRNARGGASGGGASHPDAYQAFVAADRGVYRGGETVQASVLIRDRELRDVPVMPVEIALTSIDGKARHKTVGTTDAHGRLTAQLPLPCDLATGQYEVRVGVPGHAEELGRAGLQVADYIPETLRLSVSLTAAAHSQPSGLTLQAERLAGGEAGGLRGKIMAEYLPTPFSPDGWKEWTFGDGRLENRNGKTVERQVVTEADGTAATEWPNPTIETPAAVAMWVLAEILEPGGRAIGENANAVLHQSPFYLGIKTETPRPQAGSEVSFLLASVAPDGQAFTPPSDWRARLYRVEYNGMLRRRNDGRLVYDWQRREILEEEASGAWDDARGHLTFSSLIGGSYRLVVESETGKAATVDFSVHGGAGGWTGADPEALAMEVAKPRYPVDSIAEVTVNAPFAGRAVVAVEGDRVLKHWVRTLEAGENTLEIPVEETMRPNAYVTVTLVRPVGPEETWRPHRAVGAVNLEVDNTDRRVVAAIDAPDAVAPGKEVAVAVRVTDVDGGKVAGAAVVLWGVDEGILGLTGYRTPSPWEHFYRRRRLSVLDSDMYSRLAPELAAWRQGQDPLPGGGDGASPASRRLNPIHAERVRAAVIYRGDLVTNEKGVAEATIHIPEIASKMRLMAWATVGRKMGSGEKEIDVKAPVSLQASWPRFAAPGDEFQVAVTLLNRSGEEAEVTLSARAESGLELTPAVHAVRIPDEGTRQVVLSAKATGTGKARAVLRASGGGDAFTQTMELAVRPPVLFQRRSGVEEIAPGGRSRFVLADDLFPENGRLGLTVGGSPQIKLSGTLEYLVGYPYACGEQTASRLAALVTLPDLLSLSRPGQLGAAEAAELARACTDRLAELQASSGGFRMWPGWDDAEFWLSAQVLYLLEECAERDWPVPESLLENCREYLGRRLDDHVEILTKDPQSLSSGESRYADGEDAALACLALARGNALRRSWLVRMNEIAVERAANGRPLAAQALAFLCHATLLAGDPVRAQELFDLQGPGGNEAVAAATPFGNAAWLAAGLRLGVPRAALTPTAARLERELPDSYVRWSTRENVWVLLALGKYWQRFRPAPESRAWMMVNGKEREFALSAGANWPDLLPGAVVEAEARGEDPLHFVWTAEGVPVSGKAQEEDVGMMARRSVFDLDGKALAAPYVLRQGEVYRIRLDIAGEADDLVVADLLPAGLEVENPRLKGRDGERTDALHIKQVERRDDRMLLFGAVRKKGFYEYLCRAVTPGAYVWPAVDAGRMYDSGVRSVHGEGRLVVKAVGEVEHD